jgi:hypothetical protein
MADSARPLRDQQQEQQQEGAGTAAAPAKQHVTADPGPTAASSGQQARWSSFAGVPHPLVALVRMLLSALVARTQLACNK